LAVRPVHEQVLQAHLPMARQQSAAALRVQQASLQQRQQAAERLSAQAYPSLAAAAAALQAILRRQSRHAAAAIQVFASLRASPLSHVHRYLSQMCSLHPSCCHLLLLQLRYLLLCPSLRLLSWFLLCDTRRNRQARH
jgi:hypothetical protein